MKKRVWAASPIFFLVIVFMYILSASSWFWDKNIFLIEMLISTIIAVIVTMFIFKFKTYTKTALSSAALNLEFTNSNVLNNFSTPIVIVGKLGEIVWANSYFFTNVQKSEDCIGLDIKLFTSGIPVNSILRRDKTDIEYNGIKYTVYGVNFESNVLLFFTEDTFYKDTVVNYKNSQPAVATIMFDNKDELISDSQNDGIDTQIIAIVENTLQKWACEYSGFFKKLSDGKYLVLLEQRHVEELVKNKFEILDKIRNIKMDEHLWATISVGIGKGAKTFAECELWSRKALDMALGRGGDQVAIKDKDSFEFYGGISKGVEKRDMVRTRVIASMLSENIKNSDCTFIMGHRFPDLDSVGASIGMWGAITNGQGKPAYVVINDENSLAAPLMDNIINSGNENMFIRADEALNLVSDRSLLIVVDTHSPSFVESTELYNKCKRIVVIDHHRLMINRIDTAIIFYHDPYASSASEMVTDLSRYLGEDSVRRTEAQALLAGIMLDTKNFVLKTGARTFEAAAFLKRRGADTVEVKKLFASSINTYKMKYKLVSSAEIYNGCAVTCADESFKNIRTTAAQAADELLGIQGVVASFVIFPFNDEISISARSLGSVNVQVIMEKFGGGGHQTMAGVQLKGKNINQVKSRLVGVLRNIEIHNDV